ncbi:hypothetical protein [Paenibacillus sp. NPDC057967]|uniref:hypothetical protein n=1 Tax=Paenibacillus sp. NPDC057967 TaxID=3346293 RepID=UPI0036DCDD4E
MTAAMPTGKVAVRIVLMPSVWDTSSEHGIQADGQFHELWKKLDEIRRGLRAEACM